MERIDSLDKTYSKISKLSIVECICLLLSFCFSIITIIWFVDFLLVMYIVVVVLYFFVSLAKELTIQYAEKLRIVNCIEVAYGEDITSSVETINYYNNSSIGKGIERFEINIFESVFFTKRNYDIVFPFKLIMCILLILVYITSLIVSPVNLALIITQTIFGSSVAVVFAKEIYFYIQLRKIYNFYDEIYVSGKYNNRNNKEKMLGLCFEYEKLKSYTTIQTSTKIFKKYNDKWSAEWEEYKQKYIKKK